MDKDFTRKRYQLSNGFNFSNMGERDNKKISRASNQARYPLYGFVTVMH